MSFLGFIVLNTDNGNFYNNYYDAIFGGFFIGTYSMSPLKGVKFSIG